MRYKRWATIDLIDLLAENLGRLTESDRVLVLRLLDHIHTVDEIFCHNLERSFHGHLEPKSISLPTFEALAQSSRAIASWYVDYADDLTPERREETIGFNFVDGAPGRMTRGEMLLHIAAHGTYHRGNIGMLLQKNCVQPPADRITNFLDLQRGRL